MCPGPAPQTTAAPPSAALTTATTTASARTTRLNFPFAGEDAPSVAPSSQEGVVHLRVSLLALQLPGRRGLLVHGSEVRHQDDSRPTRGHLPRRPARRCGGDRGLGIRGGATLPSRSDPGQSGPDEEQVHAHLAMCTQRIHNTRLCRKQSMKAGQETKHGNTPVITLC